MNEKQKATLTLAVAAGLIAAPTAAHATTGEEVSPNPPYSWVENGVIYTDLNGDGIADEGIPEHAVTVWLENGVIHIDLNGDGIADQAISEHPITSWVENGAIHIDLNGDGIADEGVSENPPYVIAPAPDDIAPTSPQVIDGEKADTPALEQTDPAALPLTWVKDGVRYIDRDGDGAADGFTVADAPQSWTEDEVTYFDFNHDGIADGAVPATLPPTEQVEEAPLPEDAVAKRAAISAAPVELSTTAVPTAEAVAVKVATVTATADVPATAPAPPSTTPSATPQQGTDNTGVPTPPSGVPVRNATEPTAPAAPAQASDLPAGVIPAPAADGAAAPATDIPAADTAEAAPSATSLVKTGSDSGWMGVAFAGLLSLLGGLLLIRHSRHA